MRTKGIDISRVQEQLVNDSDYKFILDVREHCEKKVGELTFPDAECLFRKPPARFGCCL